LVMEGAAGDPKLNPLDEAESFLSFIVEVFVSKLMPGVATVSFFAEGALPLSSLDVLAEPP